MYKNAIHASGTVTLQIAQSPSDQADFYIESPGAEGYIIGRSDSSTHYLPDIDLATFGAREKGLSRRHAALVSHRDHVHIIDLGSMNGTFVNGKRLPANVAYGLSKGDKLTFASLDLIVSHIH